MTATYRSPKNINKAKAVSALSVGGVSYPAVTSLIDQWISGSGLADSWLNSSAAHHWIGVVVAAVMAGIAAWRTSSDPGKVSEKRQAKFDAKVADAVARNNGAGEA